MQPTYLLPNYLTGVYCSVLFLANYPFLYCTILNATAEKFRYNQQCHALVSKVATKPVAHGYLHFVSSSWFAKSTDQEKRLFLVHILKYFIKFHYVSNVHHYRLTNKWYLHITPIWRCWNWIESYIFFLLTQVADFPKS